MAESGEPPEPLSVRSARLPRGLRRLERLDSERDGIGGARQYRNDCSGVAGRRVAG